MTASHHTLLTNIFSLLFFAAAAAVVNANLYATIESCQGWALNKMPQLKSFLKDGEAESYRNVEVKFIHGRKAVMTVWETGNGNGGVLDGGGDRESWEEVEKITLSDYKTKVCLCEVTVHGAVSCCILANRFVFVYSLQNSSHSFQDEMHALFVEKGWVDIGLVCSLSSFAFLELDVICIRDVLLSTLVWLPNVYSSSPPPSPVQHRFQMKSEVELAAYKIQKEKEAEEERERKQKQREQNIKMQEERTRQREMEKEEDRRRQEEMWGEKEQEEQARIMLENEVLEDEPAVPLEDMVTSDPVEEFQDEL